MPDPRWWMCGDLKAQGASVNADCEIPIPFRADQYVAVLREVTLSAPVYSDKDACWKCPSQYTCEKTWNT